MKPSATHIIRRLNDLTEEENTGLMYYQVFVRRRPDGFSVHDPLTRTSTLFRRAAEAAQFILSRIRIIAKVRDRPL